MWVAAHDPMAGAIRLASDRAIKPSSAVVNVLPPEPEDEVELWDKFPYQSHQNALTHCHFGYYTQQG